MGTSSSYSGSSSKAAKAIRDSVDSWSKSQANEKTPVPTSAVAQALNMPGFTRGHGGRGRGGGGGGGGKQSGPRRSASTYAATASRAARLARAYREGDRAVLEKAGLDFDKLSALPTRAELVRAILDVVCGTDMGSDIPAEEQREISAHLMDWMLDADQNPTPPNAAETSEHAIGLIIAETFLSEAGEFTSTDAASREEFIEGVYESSKVLAAESDLSGTGATQDDIDRAIQKGLRWLRRTHAKDNG